MNAPAVSAGDTAWVLVAAALVFVMNPGLAFFYAGLVRRKNTLNTLMMTYVAMGVGAVVWMAAGYSLAFAPGSPFLGGLRWLGLSGVGGTPEPDYAATIPALAFFAFQGMFATITPALVSGAIVERMSFRAYVIFLAAWSLVVYAPVAHWVWGTGGFLRAWGALDFAGGTVVHVTAGTAALVAARMLGPRQDFKRIALIPHNVPYVLLGAGLLWFGWFGFNAGSALGANETAVTAFVATHTAAVAAALSWMTVEWVHRGAPTVLGIASGAVAGLAMVTPGAGYVSAFSALLMGLVAGGLSYLTIIMKGRFGYDDSLDVVGIHGVAGVMGMLLTGLLASKAVNPGGADGLLAGNAALLGAEALTVVVVALFASGATFVILKVVDRLVGLRLSPEEERMGLDISQHNERAYS